VGSSEVSRYRSAAEKAIRFIERNQHNDGGWRYTADVKRPGDTSVSGWQVLALKSAIEAGIPVSDVCIARVRKLFDARASEEYGRTGYNDRIPLTEATTGVGMLARQFLLDEPDCQLVRDAAVYLADHAEMMWSDREASGDLRDYYLWYNCTLAMFQAGGEPWQRWNRLVRDTIIAMQCQDGCERGSWSPESKWGEEGGRIYTTALAVLTLEVYYRYASHVESTGSFSENVTALDLSEPDPESVPVELNAEGDSAMEEETSPATVEPEGSDASAIELNAEGEQAPKRKKRKRGNASGSGVPAED